MYEQIRTRHGTFLILKTCGYCLGLRYYGELSQPEFDLLGRVLGVLDADGDYIPDRKPLNIIDAGAWIGYHSTVFANWAGKDGSILAIEPQPLIAAMLRLNIEQNRSHVSAPVDICQAFASDKDSAKFVKLPDYHDDNNRNTTAMFKEEAGSEMIESVAIDKIDFCSGIKEKLHLLKIDVEGAEAEVLEGARDTIELYTPVIYAEVLDETALRKIYHFLTPMGYSLKLHQYHDYNPQNFNHNPRVGPENATTSNVLAIHEEDEESMSRLENLKGIERII